MSLNGVTAGAAALLRPQELSRPKVEQERMGAQVAPQPRVARPKVVGAGLLAPRTEGLAVEAPAGTDPELWQVLSAEERSYFAKMTALGPLTYGRAGGVGGGSAGRGGEAPVARGGRIDVKV